jgi:hypothetical protein
VIRGFAVHGGAAPNSRGLSAKVLLLNGLSLDFVRIPPGLLADSDTAGPLVRRSGAE